MTPTLGPKPGYPFEEMLEISAKFSPFFLSAVLSFEWRFVLFAFTGGGEVKGRREKRNKEDKMQELFQVLFGPRLII